MKVPPLHRHCDRSGGPASVPFPGDRIAVRPRCARRGALLLALIVALAGTATPLHAATPVDAAAGGTATTSGADSAPDASATGPFTVDTNLLSSTGLSAWAIDRYLAANTPLPPIGSAFKAAEIRYGINARYLLAHAMLETGFGTSFFATNHRNLFGWTAFNRDPGKYASRFPSYADGIDYVASRIHAWYLVPNGRYYGGAPTLRGMHMYASDPEWEERIARIANTIAIPTLAGSEFEIARPVIKATVFAGRKVTVSVDLDPCRRQPRGCPTPCGSPRGGGPLRSSRRARPPRRRPPRYRRFELVSGRTKGRQRPRVGRRPQGPRALPPRAPDPRSRTERSSRAAAAWRSPGSPSGSTQRTRSPTTSSRPMTVSPTP